MLLNREDIFELFRCPKTGASLKKISAKKFVSDNEEKIEYEIIDGYPILVDFVHSILSEETTLFGRAKSVIQRTNYKGLIKSLKKLVSPNKKITIENVNEILSRLKSSNSESKVLIIGGGAIGQGMDAVYEEEFVQLISFDIYASPYVQFVADAHKIPLPENYFDCVIIQAVLEHVLEPNAVVSEIYRVLKPGGLVYAETPFMQHVHEGAYDFTRFTESGHRYLFRNFKKIRSGANGGPGTQLLWSIDFFFRSLFRSRMVGKFFKTAFFWLRQFDKIIPESYSIDAASGVFFLGCKHDTFISSKDIIKHYRGAQL